MTYKAIPIVGYSLIVSDEKPKRGDLCMLNNTPVIFIDPDLTITVTGLKDQDRVILNVPNYKVIIAQSKQVHEGVPLFDTPWEENVEKLAGKYADDHSFRVPYNGTNDFYDKKDFKYSKEGFIEGYNAAKAKYEFTREDMEKAIWAARPDEHNRIAAIDTIIQSLKNPKVYEVEIEMTLDYDKFDDLYTPKIPKITNNKVNIISWKEI